MLSTLALSVYVAALLVAAISDVLHYEIPDTVSAVLIAGFLPIAIALPVSLSLAHVAAAAAVFAVATLLFAGGVWGGGDVKLMAATALWIGWQELAAFLLLTALLGAVLALTLLATRAVAGPRVAAGHWYSRVLSRDEGVPYGVAIAASGLMLLSLGALPATVAAPH